MNKWPHLDDLGWRKTCSALHLYLQIAGKYRLAHTPWLNHSWNATFYVTPSGLASSPTPDGPGIEILFDFRAHRVVGTCGNGRTVSFDLGPTTVATFHGSFVRLISELGGTPTFNGRPNEVPFPIPFAEGDHDRPYDLEAVQRFHPLVGVDKVFNRFRTSFLGKSSPVQLFWGSFDLAPTRLSGRRAPLHPGGVPALPDDVAREAYDCEISSAGFWPGGGGIDYPAFYAYAYPAPHKRVLSTFIARAFVQETPEPPSRQWRSVSDQIRLKVPQQTNLMDQADMLVYKGFRSRIREASVDKLHRALQRRTFGQANVNLLVKILLGPACHPLFFKIPSSPWSQYGWFPNRSTSQSMNTLTFGASSRELGYIAQSVWVEMSGYSGRAGTRAPDRSSSDAHQVAIRAIPSPAEAASRTAPPSLMRRLGVTRRSITSASFPRNVQRSSVPTTRQACSAKSSGVFGRPRCSIYSGDATSTRLSGASRRATKDESLSSVYRTATSKAPSTRSTMLSEMRKSRASSGYLLQKSGRPGTICIRANEAGAATRNVPRGAACSLPSAARADSAASTRCSAWGRKARPSSVKVACRVVRWRSLALRFRSSAASLALAPAGVRPKSRAAALMLRS